MTVTRNRFSVSSFIAPEMDPIAQQSVLRLPHDHSDPSTCFDNFSVTVGSICQSHVEEEKLGRLTDGLRVDNVEMSEVDENLPHALVENDGINLLQELSHDLSLVVLNNQDLQVDVCQWEFREQEREGTHFFRLSHSLDHDQSEVRRHLRIDTPPPRLYHTSRSKDPTASETEVEERVVHLTHGELLDLVVEVRDQLGPVFETDLENLALIDL